MKSDLTSKQRAFVECFEGNATEAAKKAGYEGSDKTLAQIGYENMRKPDIREEIEKRTAVVLEPLIAGREQRQEFWTKVMEDLEMPMRDRLRASELLAKSEGDFLPKEETNEESDLLSIIKRMHERRIARGLGSSSK